MQILHLQPLLSQATQQPGDAGVFLLAVEGVDQAIAVIIKFELVVSQLGGQLDQRGLQQDP